MKARQKHNSPYFIRLKCFEMYKNGLNFYDIAKHFNISVHAAESHVIGYAKVNNISTEQLEKDRDIILKQKINDHKVKKNNPYSTQMMHGLEQKKYSESDLKSIQIPTPHLSFFQKIKLAIYHIIFFWK